MQYCNKESWYVIRVRSQAEDMVYNGLLHKQFKVLNPTYKTLSARKDRKKILSRPIFNGYLFIRTFLNPEYHLEILKTPGVVDFLKSGIGPSIVPEEQIENVLLLEKHVGDCFFETDFILGDTVFVREGPLTGLKGVIDRKDQKKLHIHVDSIPGSITIVVEPNKVQIEKDTVYQLVTNS